MYTIWYCLCINIYIYNDKINSKGDPISSQFHQDIKTSRLVPSPSRHRGPDKARQGEHELDNWEEESEVHRALGAHHDTLDKKPDTKIEKTWKKTASHGTLKLIERSGARSGVSFVFLHKGAGIRDGTAKILVDISRRSDMAGNKFDSFWTVERMRNW